ncbi:MAG: response regulator [Planctomycetes bacterium]|nr:response regulator [Planctomycetota bacterium]
MALNILVVDDSKIMRSVIIQTLRMTGLPLHEVREAGDGKEGLEILRKEWVDLVFLDLNMPVMGGLEMIGHLQTDPDLPEVPIIVVSTESSQTRIDALVTNGIHFVHKPFTPEDVRAAIADLIGEVSHGDEGIDPGVGDPGSF